MSRTPFIKKDTNNTQSFLCSNCGSAVAPPESGTKQRNHCPICLCSLHVDLRPGDRLSSCRAVMDPVALWVKKNGEWALIHRCRGCGKLQQNRIAGDDSEARLFYLAAQPLTNMPFPAEKMLSHLSENGGRI